MGLLALDQLADAGLHFSSGLIGKGHGGYIVGLITAFLNQIGNFLGDHRRFTRPRAGQHQ